MTRAGRFRGRPSFGSFLSAFVGATDEAHEQRRPDRCDEPVHQGAAARERTAFHPGDQNRENEKADHQHHGDEPTPPDALEIAVEAPFPVRFDAGPAATDAYREHRAEDHQIFESRSDPVVDPPPQEAEHNSENELDDTWHALPPL